MTVVFWGTYDLGKPRNRMIIDGLRRHGIDVIECHAPVWTGVKDKSLVTGAKDRARLLAAWLAAYPRLVWRYLRLPPHDAVIVGYLGQLDVLVLWPFARARSVPVVWDAFLSLYNTVVEDRRMAGPKDVAGRLLWAWEWLACQAADRITLDTAAHAAYFHRTFNLSADRLDHFFVGAEEQFCCVGDVSATNPETPFTVLFYGQFIPLHGIDTIVHAARLTAGEGIRWIVVGKGQENERIDRMLEADPVPDLERISWIPYEQLHEHIARADVCLGIFGRTEKAANVIPNKAFQILAAGARLITMDSPAIRELVGDSMPGVGLVPPGDAEALADRVRETKEAVERGYAPKPPDELRAAVGIPAVTTRLVRLLERLTNPEQLSSLAGEDSP